ARDHPGFADAARAIAISGDDSSAIDGPGDAYRDDQFRERREAARDEGRSGGGAALESARCSRGARPRGIACADPEPLEQRRTPARRTAGTARPPERNA